MNQDEQLKQRKPASVSQGQDRLVPVDPQEVLADDIAAELEADSAEPEKVGYIVNDVMRSYASKRTGQTIEDWLEREFSKHPECWSSDKERLDDVQKVIASVDAFNAAKNSLQEHLDQGKSTTNWLAGTIERGAAASGSVSVGAYAGNIDQAITKANESALATITRQDGGINLGRNLDGFIAEQHHVDTFNIDAASKGSKYQAKVLTPKPGEGYTKNSMDIGIYDENGKLVRRYQAKYCSDAEATQKAFEHGDYRGQQKLVPEGQGKDVAGSTEVIEIDGVSSKPLSKEDAREKQRQAQEEELAKEYDWNDASRTDITKEIGRQVVIAASLGSAFHGVRIFGRRILNKMTGKVNQEASEDLVEFLDSSLTSTAHAGTQVAVSGALVIACRKGVLGEVMKKTPAGQLANIASIGMENTKVLYKLVCGKLSNDEALDALANTNMSAVGALTGAVKGGKIGSAVFTVFGPTGIVVGGMIGSIVGGMAGSKVAENIYSAGKSLSKSAAVKAKALIENISVKMSGMLHSAKKFITNLLPW